MKQQPRFPIDEEQARTRLDDQVAHRVEEEIADEIGRRQRVALDLHETRLAAAMGHIRAFGMAGILTRIDRRDEERIGC